MTANANGHAVVVDVRYLLPPEPMERALEALSLLGPGQHLLLLIHREPFPLYQLLEARGFSHAAQLHGDGTFTITIRRAP